LFEGDIQGAHLVVAIEDGAITLDPIWEISCDFDYGIEEFRTVLGGDVALDLTLVAQATGSITYDHVQTFPGYVSSPFTIGWIGPIPVIARVHVDFEAGFEAALGASATLETGLSASAGVRLGGLYQRGLGWDPIWQADAVFSPDGCSHATSGSVELRGFVRPVLSLQIYESAGGYLAAEPYLRYLYSPSSSLPAWWLMGGLAGSVGIEVEILDWELAHWEHSFDGVERVIACECDMLVDAASCDAVHGPRKTDAAHALAGRCARSAVAGTLTRASWSWQEEGNSR